MTAAALVLAAGAGFAWGHGWPFTGFVLALVAVALLIPHGKKPPEA